MAGLRLAGLGGCPRYSDGPNQYTDRQQARRARALRGRAWWRRQRDGRGVDVLLTHAPPRGVGDGDDPPHRGFGGLRGLVAALQPAALLHGHVHPYGAHVRLGRLGRTAVCNVTGWHLLELEPGAWPGRAAPGSSPCPDTGFPRADVENDFLRARRRQALARLAQWLRREPDDVNLILPFDEVVAALGMRGERRLGLQTIRLDTIVGTVDSRPGLRPPVPAHQRAGQGAVGAAGPGPAPRRVDPAHRRVPHR